MIAPQKLGARAKDPTRGREIEQFYAQLLEDYRAIAQKKGVALNDVARAAAFVIVVSHDVYAGDAASLSARQLDAVRAQMHEIFSEDPQFQRLSDREKQELYEGYAIMGMLISSLYDGSVRANHQQGVDQMRHLAGTLMEEIFGVPFDRLIFSDEGVRYR